MFVVYSLLYNAKVLTKTEFVHYYHKKCNNWIFGFVLSYGKDLFNCLFYSGGFLSYRCSPWYVAPPFYNERLRCRRSSGQREQGLIPYLHH